MRPTSAEIARIAARSLGCPGAITPVFARPDHVAAHRRYRSGARPAARYEGGEIQTGVELPRRHGMGKGHAPRLLYREEHGKGARAGRPEVAQEGVRRPE